MSIFARLAFASIKSTCQCCGAQLETPQQYRAVCVRCTEHSLNTGTNQTACGQGSPLECRA